MSCICLYLIMLNLHNASSYYPSFQSPMRTVLIYCNWRHSIVDCLFWWVSAILFKCLYIALNHWFACLIDLLIDWLMDKNLHSLIFTVCYPGTLLTRKSLKMVTYILLCLLPWDTLDKEKLENCNQHFLFCLPPGTLLKKEILKMVTSIFLFFPQCF